MKSKILLIFIAAVAVAASVGGVRWFEAALGGRGKPDANPASRAATPTQLIDLSATYGKVNHTVFNKKTRVIFATPQEFFDDSGVSSFEGLKFDELRRLPVDLRLVNGRRMTRVEADIIEAGR